MKIYFAGSIRGGRNDKDLYMQIIELLKNYGEVLTEHIGGKNLTANGEVKTSEFIYNRDMNWIKDADYVIAEVTQPSLGVGYELGKTDDLNKKCLCLYREQEGKRLSAMIDGNKNFAIKRYKTLDEVKIILDKFFKNL